MFKKILLGIAACISMQSYGQDLSLNLKNGQTYTYGLNTIKRIEFTSTDMVIKQSNGVDIRHLMNDVNFFNYKATISNLQKANKNRKTTVKLMPNPSTGLVLMQCRTATAEKYRIRVFNQRGQVVHTAAGKLQIGVSSQGLDLSSASKGIYFIELTYGKQHVIEKLILK